MRWEQGLHNESAVLSSRDHAEQQTRRTQIKHHKDIHLSDEMRDKEGKKNKASVGDSDKGLSELQRQTEGPFSGKWLGAVD